VTRDEDVRKIFERSEAELGPLYGLICAAGVYGPIGNFGDLDLSEWIKALDINLVGTARTIHAALPGLKKNGAGRIILMSGGGQGAMANFSSYVTSKGGIWRLTETLAAELKEANIFVNAIAPGAVNSKLLDDLLEAGPERVPKEIYERSVEQKKKGGASPDKAAELSLYLLSDESRGLTGKTLSALWDPYRDFADLEEISAQDIFCMRRVIDERGGTRFS
jgi:3-oxoacyl-[acyl-carrier protein] reductase